MPEVIISSDYDKTRLQRTQPHYILVIHQLYFNMNINYVAVPAGSVDEGAQFFQTILGYEPAGELELWLNIRCKIFTGRDDAPQLLLLPKDSPVKNKNLIILNTDSCLKDYYELTKRGLGFITPPSYRPGGLAAEFEDSLGNYYILLEQREYDEI